MYEGIGLTLPWAWTIQSGDRCAPYKPDPVLSRRQPGFGSVMTHVSISFDGPEVCSCNTRQFNHSMMPYKVNDCNMVCM